MSDVSGIPYMGPMGMGGFFSNPFGNGGMSMSAGQISSPYMPEIYNNQNVVNNLFNTPGGGGGFGRATDYYSQLGANYLAQVPSSWEMGGGGGASPYQTSANVWDTGASPFQGGGGSSGFGGSIYDFSGGLGSLGASPYMTTPNVWDTGSRGYSYPGAGGIDWGGLFQSAPSSAGNFGAGMFGGLAGGMGGAYQGQNNQMDWGNLFGGGGAKTDPAPGMAMPGGLGSPMSAPQQQQPDFNELYAQRSGGLDTHTSPFEDVGATSPMVGTSLEPFGGGGGVGGLTWGTASGQPYTAPATPNQFPMEGTPVTEAYNPYFDVTSPSSEPSGGEVQGPAQPQSQAQGPAGDNTGGGLSAADLGEQARAELARTMADFSRQQPTTESDASATPFDPRGARTEAPGVAASAAGAVAGAQPESNALYPSWSEWLSKNIGNPFVSPAGAAEQGPGFAERFGGDRGASAAGVWDGVTAPGQDFAGRWPDTSIFAPSAASYDPSRDQPSNPAMDQPLPGNPYTDPQFGAAPGAQPDWGNPASGVVGPRGSAFGFEPGGFEAGGTNNQFAGAPAAPAPAPEDVWDKVPVPAAAGAPEASPTAAPAGDQSVPLPRARPEGVDAPRPSGEIFPEKRLAPNGQEPEAFVVHHTGGRPTLQGTVADWKDPNSRSHGTLGSQYFMDRNGKIYDVRAETGYDVTNHTKSGNVRGAEGLGNHNTVGMEISARDDNDVTPAQLQSLKEFAANRYPDTPFYGHKEIDSGKGEREGFSGANAILDARVGSGYMAPPSVGGDKWQSSIPQAQRTPEVTAAIQAQADRFGIPAASIPAVLGLETGGTWNPQSRTGSQIGVAQMAPADFLTAGGRLGGMTYDEYRQAPLARQITAYGDYLNSSPNKGMLAYGARDPAMVSALLMAMQLSPQSTQWASALNRGDTSTPVRAQQDQARELGNTSIDAMRNAFAKRIAGW